MNAHRARRRPLPSFRGDRLIGLAAVLAFSPVLGFGFVYDDAWTIVENRWLERPFTELFGLFVSGEALLKKVPDATRPAMVFSLWLDRRIFGDSATGPHLVSLLLYGLTSVFATALAARLTRKRGVAFVTGAFFAFAPLHAEPVAAVNYREDLLAAAGVLGAWICLLGTLPSDATAKRWKYAMIGAGAWVTALLAKESAVVLVPLFGLTALFIGRERDNFRKAWRYSVPFLVVGVLWTIWRTFLTIRGDDIPLAPRLGAGETLLRTTRFMVQSVYRALFPLDWAPDHWRQPDAGVAWLIYFALILAAIVVLERSHRGRMVAFGLAIAMVAPLPSSPISRPVNELADRYFFIGVFGGGIAWGSLFAIVGDRLKLVGKKGPLLALSCVLLLWPTLHAISIWRDERTLWSSAVQRQPRSPRAWAALSRVHRLAGEHRAAAETIERAIALDAGYAPALVTRVFNEIQAGDLTRARAHAAEIDRGGMGNHRGMRKVRECVKLDSERARSCLNR